MAEARIYTLLANSSLLNVYVNNRIYPVVMPQDVILPAVCYSRVSDDKLYALDGYSNLDHTHISINSWASNYDTVKTIAEQVRLTMDASPVFKSTLANELDVFDPDISLYAVSQDYSIWNQEA